MLSYFPEVFVQRALATHLYSRGYQVREEVLFGSSRFDIIALTGTRVVGYEVKMGSWSRAMNQADIYQLCCDEVYLVIPSVRLNASIEDRCVARGLGLITIGPPPEWQFAQILAAPQSQRKNSLHNASIRSIAAFK